MTRHGLSWMDDRLHTGTIQGLRDAWRRDGHPGWTGLTADQVMQGDALQERLSSLLDGVEGDDVGRLGARLVELHAHEDIMVDALDVALARRTGTDMLAALCIAAELRRMTPSAAFVQIVRGPARRGRMDVDTCGGTTRITTPLSPEARWCGGTLTMDRVLPHTFHISVQGRPLAQLVSHPLLDPLGLTIERTETVNGRETRVTTSHRPAMIAATGIHHDDLASDESALDTPPPSRRRSGGGTVASPF